MITIENKNEMIYLFDRIPETTQAKMTENWSTGIRKILNFKPYFYAEDKEGTFKSIDGKKLKRIVVGKPQDVRTIRDKYKHYEADIVYTNRYIIDMFDKIEKERIRTCYIDIEIMETEKGYEGIEVVNNIINCIGCYDNFTGKYVQFVLSEEFDTEKELLTEFIKYIQFTNPDMLVAWNGEGFDFPFLINKIKKLKLPTLGRMNEPCYTKKLQGTNSYRSHVFGRICFDLMEAYKKMNSYGGRESWSLDYISRYELGDKGGKEEYKGSLDELFKKDLDKFVAYNKRDVELIKLIDEKLQIINFFDELRRLCLCKFEDVFMNSKMADCLCLKYARQNGFVLPSCKDNEKESFEGAYVHDSEPKLYKNVAVMDMKSLYPSIIIGFNISPETIRKEKSDIGIDDKYFFIKEKGIIPAIIKPLLDKRKQYKDNYLTQYALKVVANSFYGVMGMKYFRLYNNDCASSVTYIARRVIKEVHNWFKEKGFNIIYGDTDSCFIEMGEATIDDMNKFNKEINEYFKTYFRQFGVEDKNNIFKLEFEKVFSSVFFKRKADGEGAKKKYAGRIVFKDEEPCDEFSVTGFESKRSDSPDVGRKFMNEVLKMICYEKSQEEINDFIRDFKFDIIHKYSPEEIGLPISITKPLNKYANQIHAVASRVANEKHKAQIEQGDKIKYIYIKEPERVVAWKSYKTMPKGYTIDFDKMIRRIVDLKIGPLFTSLGWDYEYSEVKKEKKPKKEKEIKSKKVRESFYPELKQRSLF
jgi:DNA polymerase I